MKNNVFNVEYNQNTYKSYINELISINNKLKQKTCIFNDLNLNGDLRINDDRFD